MRDQPRHSTRAQERVDAAAQALLCRAPLVDRAFSDGGQHLGVASLG